MKIIKLNYGLILLVLLSTLFLSNESHFNTINYQDRNELPTPAQSQFSQGSLTVDQNFSLIETSENSGTKKNVSSVNIDFDNSRWNVTNINLNITNMSFKNETKIIEDKSQSTTTISKSDFFNLGVQIELLAPTTIYGIYIYGENRTTSDTVKKTYLQIQGNNKNTRKPNGTILCSISLNMSKSNGLCWHMHKLSSPLNLNKGFYYLVLNGTNIGTTPKIYYDWKYCYENPYYPNLNISRYYYSDTQWGDAIPSNPYLYKIVQKINKTFNPTEINMTTKINGIDKYFQNGNKLGSGNLSVSLNNFFPNVLSLQFPVKNNVSEALIFNLSYYVKLNNSLICGGSVVIKDGLENKWTIEPNLMRFGWNYSVSYKYSKSWEIIDVFKNENRLTGNNYTNYQNILTILNNTIPTTLESWKIIANSTFFKVNLINPLPNFNAGEKIGFTIQLPVKIGSYTFVLIDTTGDNENQQTFLFPTKTSYNWTIPSNAISGGWIAYYYWNNQTDAGAGTHPFTVSGGQIITNILAPASDDDSGNGKTEVTGLDPFVVFMTILIIGIVSASSFTSYATLKKVKKDRDIRRKKLFDKVTNILNLSHVIVIDKNSGLNVYQEFYGGSDLDTTLVSGFLDAIRSFGIELTSARTQSQTISLEYQASKILMAEFKSFRLIFIMTEKASEEFLKSIENLSYDIDNNFGEELRNFKGDIVKFREIRNLIEKHLNTAFIYPLKVFEPKDLKLNPSERAMILKAKKFMKENNLNYFFTSFLLSEQNLNPKDIEIIFKLVEKKIFQPIELSSNIK